MSAPELKPCPFCGGIDVSINDATRILGTWNIVHRCKVVGPIMIDGYDRDRTIAKWNTRADLSTPPPADFAAFMALAFPWLHEAGADHKNLKAAWDAGWKAGRG